eukprot:2061209-Amphidinium_carterae.1
MFIACASRLIGQDGNVAKLQISPLCASTCPLYIKLSRNNEHIQPFQDFGMSLGYNEFTQEHAFSTK